MANKVAAAMDPSLQNECHGHWDHAGGNEDLVRLLSKHEDVNEVISVFGGIGR
ncbi:unnamed protein product [Albugo candida]|uniref:Uncharacterized protein n=1 Tax=Albugo candida TaxID=65357 RepID=A0A024FUS6_9STRA|nr:unnamed protein product [Albugo candida]|eukprot:CCI10796.1 unnamed protein product [Albugo candida]